MVEAAALVYVPPAYVLSPLPSSATYSVCGLANHSPNGNAVELEDLASVVGNPFRMHMLLRRPVVCRVAGL